jgi:hypothetical protein
MHSWLTGLVFRTKFNTNIQKLESFSKCEHLYTFGIASKTHKKQTNNSLQKRVLAFLVYKTMLVLHSHHKVRRRMMRKAKGYLKGQIRPFDLATARLIEGTDNELKGITTMPKPSKNASQ